MEHFPPSGFSFTISVVIPCLNEEENIGNLIDYLKENDKERIVREIIVTDGGSSDKTVEVAASHGAVLVNCKKKGRASQMNSGANVAKGDVLYFLHADSYPPPSYSTDIINAVYNRYQSGCYRLSFDHDHWFLRLNCWFTRFDINAVRFGDQSLFVTREAFRHAGGFNEEMIVMEDQEIIKRIKGYARFLILGNTVTTSARKYLENGIFKLQGLFFLIYILYKLGFSQAQLLKVYRLLIRQNKV